jgi:hypothetical protein
MNYYNDILKYIRFNSQRAQDIKEGCEYDTLSHFIELLGEKEFNRVFEICFIKGTEKNTFEETFYIFHKSMRQCDFFDNHYTKMDDDDPDKNRFFKDTEYKSIGGHLDMLFWNFIHMSNITEKIFKGYLTKLKEKK